MKSKAEQIARTYFNLSNSGDLDKITQLIQADATYSSDNTGLYYGVRDIMQMMQGFFNAHISINWHIEQLECLSEHIIEIKFTCQSTNHNGIKTARMGTERLVIDNDKIRHIEVRNP